mgnify:FL=1
MEDRYLFKAKRADNGEWVTGYYTKSIVNGSVFGYIRESIFGTDIKIMLNTLCQYTGLTDKNGQKICENDVVRIGGHISEVNGIYKIIFDEINHCFALERSVLYRKSYFTFSCLNGFAEDCEVIGSIFDNPELLSE